MARWLVTGAEGMLGKDLVERLRREGHDVSALGRTRLDVLDPDACVKAAAGHDVVVNAAAWTAVDDAETSEPDAFAVNAVGAANVARGAAAAGARLVQVSTDYVFDGVGTSPYAADAPIAPRSAYGRTKAAGEWAAQALNPDTLIVRTAWLYGVNGGNFVATMAKLAGQRDTLDVVNDQRGQPTWTVDLAELVVRLVDADAPAGVYHGTSSGECTWFDLARATFTGLGLDPERVKPTDSASFVRPAPRPSYSVLSHASLTDAGVSPIRDWREGLRDYLSAAKLVS